MPRNLPFLALLVAACVASTLMPGSLERDSRRCLAADEASPVSTAKRPNILFIMTDDQGYPPVGRNGHPWIRTPNIDELYDQSVHFTRFLVCPTCSPTRSALMTGRHPMRNGVTHTILERERLTLDAVTLPQVLKRAGYTTGIFGKWHLGDEEPYQPHNRGFDETFIHGAGGIGQTYNCSCADVPGNKYFDPVIRHNGSFVKTEGFCTDVFFTAALSWIHQVKDGDAPFFCYLPTNAPHGPFTAPSRNLKRFTDLGFDRNHAGFYGMIENIDENMARLMQKLDEWHLRENTLVIFLSDNGMAGEGSGRPDEGLGNLPDGTPLLCYNAGMKGLKVSPDEGGVRVPLFLSWKGHIEPGRDIDRVTAHIDIFPTIAALAGAELPEGQVEGRSLLPLVENANAEWPDRFLYTHVGRWDTGENPDDYQWKRFAIRSQRYRFVNNVALFDMENDPGQTKNVIDEHPDIVSEMRSAYDAWWKETRPMMVNEDVPMSPTRPYHELYKKQLETTGIPKWEPPEF